jgi:hypothetical protein
VNEVGSDNANLPILTGYTAIEPTEVMPNLDISDKIGYLNPPSSHFAGF